MTDGGWMDGAAVQEHKLTPAVLKSLPKFKSECLTFTYCQFATAHQTGKQYKTQQKNEVRP